MKTVHIAPDCPAELELMIRREAAARGDVVMPARPFPWNRARLRELERAAYGDRQTELPGAGPSGSAEIAKRRAAAPLKPAAPQAPCDVGLFGDTSQQLDLVDLARTPCPNK